MGGLVTFQPIAAGRHQLVPQQNFLRPDVSAGRSKAGGRTFQSAAMHHAHGPHAMMELNCIGLE